MSHPTTATVVGNGAVRKARYRCQIRVPRGTGHGGAALLLGLVDTERRAPDNLTHLAKSMGVSTRTAANWRNKLVLAGLLDRRDGFLVLTGTGTMSFGFFDYMATKALRSPAYSPRLKLAMAVVFGEAVGFANTKRAWVRSDGERADLAGVDRSTVAKARTELKELGLVEVEVIIRGKLKLHRSKLVTSTGRGAWFIGSEKAEKLAASAAIGRSGVGSRPARGVGSRPAATHCPPLRGGVTTSGPSARNGSARVAQGDGQGVAHAFARGDVAALAGRKQLAVSREQVVEKLRDQALVARLTDPALPLVAAVEGILHEIGFCTIQDRPGRTAVKLARQRREHALQLIRVHRHMAPTELLHVVADIARDRKTRNVAAVLRRRWPLLVNTGEPSRARSHRCPKTLEDTLAKLAPKPTKVAEPDDAKALQALRFYGQGWSFAAIASRLGIDESDAGNLVRRGQDLARVAS